MNFLSIKTAAKKGVRSFATRRKIKTTISPRILDALPVYEEFEPPKPTDPAAYHRSPVTSAHCVDVQKRSVSNLDSVALSPKGTVVHGRYGDLGAVDGIPLEYLALLRPAAEGAAAVRALTSERKGTLLVYGASRANGFAACQIASKAGNAVVAVLDAEHSGEEDIVEYVKALVDEPGTAVPEEYALSKKNFADLVHSISSGDEGIAPMNADQYVEDFKANLVAYSKAFPDTRPAAVPEEVLEFKYMEKDREMWELNMQAFLEQYPPGAPPVDKAKLDAYFSKEKYQIFRDEFWKQTTGVISGDDLTKFSPPHIVQDLISSDKTGWGAPSGSGPDYFPYSFSVLKDAFPPGSEIKAGGPVVGAIICATPTLEAAAKKVSEAKSLRGKAEALQFLSHAERAAYLSANSVAAQAKGAPVFVIGGSIAGLESLEPTDVDVKEAISAMDIDDNGESRLNYFVQIYRANDFPIYSDYAIHKATEALAGPRQIIVTK